MRTPFDQFAKQMLEQALSGTGKVETEAEIIADAQHADVVYIPDPARQAERRELGLLGEMGATTCLFEPFHDPPATLDVLDCLRKQLTMHQMHVARARRERRAPPDGQPLLWVISSGRPDGAIQNLGLEALQAWPAGFYGAPVGFRLRVIVASELPKERGTLLLRLMGRGRVLNEAILELKALPEAAWERKIAFPPLIQLRLTIPDDPGLRSEEEQNLAMTTLELYETWKRRVHAEGEAQGKAEGRAEALLDLFEARGLPVSDEQRARVLACTDIEALKRWTRRAATAASVEAALD